MDKLLLAAEVAEADQLDTGSDVDGMMIMANYAVSDVIGLTLRYSETEYSSFDGVKYYDGSSSLFLQVMYSLITYLVCSSTAPTMLISELESKDLIAAEVIFTF